MVEFGEYAGKHIVVENSGQLQGDGKQDQTPGQPHQGLFRKQDLISPLARYRGKFSPAQLAFNANLQEFASQVSIICGLETGGKISSEEAYEQIKKIWHDLKWSKQQLLDQPPPDVDLLEDD